MTENDRPDDLVKVELPNIDPAFVARVNLLVNEAKSLSDLARKSRISDRTLRKWMKGESDPSRRYLVALADGARVNLLWLATGQGPKTGAAESHAAGTGLSEAVSNLVENIHLAYKVIDDYLIANRKGMSPQRKRELVQFMLDHAPEHGPAAADELQEPPSRQDAEGSYRQMAERLMKIAA